MADCFWAGPAIRRDLRDVDKAAGTVGELGDSGVGLRCETIPAPVASQSAGNVQMKQVIALRELISL